MTVGRNYVVMIAMLSDCPYENSRRDTGEIQAVKSLADERY